MGLLCAIAEQGFVQQDQILTDAMNRADVDHLAEVFETYVLNYLRFADQHRETYDLMYGREIWRSGKPTDTLQAISRHSFASGDSGLKLCLNKGCLISMNPHAVLPRLIGPRCMACVGCSTTGFTSITKNGTISLAPCCAGCYGLEPDRCR